MTDKITELHALAVLDVLDAAQEVVDELACALAMMPEHLTSVDLLADALARLDRLEVVTGVAA